MSLWASYAPGSWLAVAGPSCWALVELTHGDPRVGRARVAVTGDDPVEDLLDVLVADGVRALPGFAVVTVQHGSLRYVVRRPARLELDGHVVAADDAGTWVDGLVTGVPGRVVLAGPDAPTGAEQPFVALAGASRVVLAAEPAAPAATGLIDGVPWAAGASPPPPSSTETGRGHTRKRSEIDGPPPPAGPTVWAIRCPSGHLTPPYSVSCRVCRAALTDQPLVQVPRPVLGRLVLSTGGTVPLDRGIVLGRAPRTAEGAAADHPHLVRLGESQEISRSHAEVRLDGWQVLLRDLGSANGTTLTPPAGVVEQIRAHEDYVMEPGSVVSLADVVTFRYEVGDS